MHWTDINKGTLVSVGEDAVAHGVAGVPVNTFGGRPARVVEKSISFRWLAKMSSIRRAVGAWSNV